MYRKTYLLAAVALTSLVATSASSWAQTDPLTGKPYVSIATDQRYQNPWLYIKDLKDLVVIDKFKYDLPAGAAKNVDAVRALIAASDALGMLRQNAYVGATHNVLGSSTNQWTYFANGTMNGEPASVRVDWDYKVGAARMGSDLAPGIRMQVERDAKRKMDGMHVNSSSCVDCKEVVVASGDLSWDESKPGVFKQAGKTSAAERLLQIYLMPPAAVILGAKAADTIKLGNKGGLRELTIPVPQYKSELKATLNAKGEIVHTEMTVDGKLHSADFSEYQNDLMDFHVMFPHKIVQKVNGNTVADLTVNGHNTGRYMVWPVPKELKK